MVSTAWATLVVGALSAGCSADDPAPGQDGAPPPAADAATGDGAPAADGPTGDCAEVDLRDDTLDVLPLGDSITLGVNGGYRNRLWTRLDADGFAVDLVGSQYDQYAAIADKDHEGHPGFTTGDIRAQVDGWLTAADPDVILLMAGTNDLAWWTVEQPAEVADRLAALVDHLLSWRPAVVVLVATIPPLSSELVPPDNRDRAELAGLYDDEIRARFAGCGRAAVADVEATLTVADLYDGVHPDAAAHDRIADVWYDALRPRLP